MQYSKYRSNKTVYKNITFDSKKEAQRYGELILLEKANMIKKYSYSTKVYTTRKV